MQDKTVNLNLDQAAPPALIRVTQGDTAWRWRFPVWLDGLRWSIPTGAQAILKGLKPDGHVFAYTGSIANNEVVVDCALQMTICAGPVGCTLIILDGDNKRLHVARIALLVAADPEATFDVASDSALPAYAEVLDGISELLELASTIPDDLPGYITNWLDSNIDPATGYVLDNTLTLSDAAAPADKVGDLKSAVEVLGLSGDVIEDYYSGESLTNAGITFTKNADGTVSSTGEATGQARYYWLYNHKIDPGSYILSGAPTGAGFQSFYIQYAVFDTGTTPASSAFVTAINPAEIVVGNNKSISVRSWYKAGYVDNGHVWRTNLQKTGNENALNGKYNPRNFIPAIYAAAENAQSALTDVENIKSIVYTDIDLTWKQYNQTGSSTYNYIKSTPFELEKSAELTAVISNSTTQYSVITYASLSDAQAGYDASVGTGTSVSSTGWMNSEEYTIQPGYYIVISRDTNRDATEDEGSNISIIKSTLIGPSDITKANAKLPIFFVKEAALANAVQVDRDSNTITFTLSADNHYNDYDRLDKMQTDYAVQMSRISKDIGVDFIGTLGDIIEGFDDYLPTADYYDNYHNINERRLTDMALAYSNDDLPFIYVAGHHEMYPVRDNTDAETFEQNRGFYTNDLKVIMYGQRSPGTQGTSNYNVGYRRFNAVDISGISGGADYLQKSGVSASYYFDITKNGNKLRILVIDSCAYTAFGYSPETVTFVGEALTDAQTNSIPCIILSHIPLRWQQYRNGAGAVPANESAFDNVIIAHKSIIKAFIHGHTHCDNIVTNATLNSENIAPYSDITFPLISLACQKTAQVQPAAGYVIGDFHAYGYRNPATYAGYCFTVINYHIDTGAIKMFRFGAGDSGTYPTWTLGGA